MLVEFASVVDAVGFAVKIQRSMVRRNVGVPAEKQIVFRIGINVGDIIIDGDDIYGDGVNIAVVIGAMSALFLRFFSVAAAAASFASLRYIAG